MSDCFSRTPACLCLALALAACASPQPEVADANATSAPPAVWWSVFDWNTNEGFRTSSPDGTVTMVGNHNVDVALEVFGWSGAGDVQVTGQLRQIQCGHIEYVSPLKGGGASRVVSGGRTYDAQLPPRDESNPIPLVQMAVSAYLPLQSREHVSGATLSGHGGAVSGDNRERHDTAQRKRNGIPESERQDDWHAHDKSGSL